MTAEDNKRIVRRFYDEVMGEGRVEVLDEIMVEDFVDHGEALFGSPRGRETLRQGVAATHAILADLNVHIEEMIAEGELVGVRGVMRCRHQGTFLDVAATGHELQWRVLAIFQVVEGRIVARWFNSDSLGILRQLGVASRRSGG